MSHDTLIMHTGPTFGDNTSPSNWEPIGHARQQLTQKLWHDPAIITKAAQFILQTSFAPSATETERAKFAVAIPNSKNKGVFNKQGNRRAPRYNHHVDDSMYGDIPK